MGNTHADTHGTLYIQEQPHPGGYDLPTEPVDDDPNGGGKQFGPLVVSGLRRPSRSLCPHQADVAKTERHGYHIF